MKYKVISAVMALSLTIAVFTSCAAQNSPGESKGGFELTLTQPDISDISSEGESQPDSSAATDGGDKLTLEVSTMLVPADLHCTLAGSELIISGEVIEALEPYRTNPDGTLINGFGEKVVSAMATPYLVRVNEVYRGDVRPGDTVIVNAMNTHFNASEIYNIVIEDEDFLNIYLDIGQKAVFCLNFFEGYFPAGSTGEEVGYCITSSRDGIFEIEPENPEQASAGNVTEEPSNILHSARLTIDLNTLADEIEIAISKSAQYGLDENGKFVGYPDSAL